MFATAAEKRDAGPDVKTLHAKIGQLTLENGFFAGALGRVGDATPRLATKGAAPPDLGGNSFKGNCSVQGEWKSCVAPNSLANIRWTK